MSQNLGEVKDERTGVEPVSITKFFGGISRGQMYQITCGRQFVSVTAYQIREICRLVEEGEGRRIHLESIEVNDVNQQRMPL